MFKTCCLRLLKIPKSVLEGGRWWGVKMEITLIVCLLVVCSGTKSGVQSLNRHIQEGDVFYTFFLRRKLYLASDAVQAL